MHDLVVMLETATNREHFRHISQNHHDEANFRSDKKETSQSKATEQIGEIENTVNEQFSDCIEIPEDVKWLKLSCHQQKLVNLPGI